MNLEEQVEISILFKYYGKLLTEKQQEAIRMYVDDNLSLGEIGDELSITRQGVKDALDKAILSLKKYEDNLGFIKRDEKIRANLKNTDESIKTKIISILEDI